MAEREELANSQEETMTVENIIHYLSGELDADILFAILASADDEVEPFSVQPSIIQTYLSNILKCTLSIRVSVRKAAVNLIFIIYEGGKIHPLQLVPILIAMSSDDDMSIRSRADRVLHDIERKYHGYVWKKFKQGVLLSYQLHSNSTGRGYRVEHVLQSINTNSSQNGSQSSSEDPLITGRLSTLYSVISSSHQSRRAFIDHLLTFLNANQDLASLFPNDPMTAELFERENLFQNLAPLQQYIMDNVIWLPYSVLDEPFYILSQLEVSISVSGSHVQATFRDILNFQDDYEDEDEEGNPRFMSQDGSQSSATSSATATPVKSESSMSITANGSDNGRLDENGESLMNTSQTSFSSGVAKLVRSLREFYMLCWCKQMIRELYSVTDVKFQDYSPNENQEVWDQQMHRRVIDSRILNSLMKYPEVNIKIDEPPNEQAIRAEFRRFKNFQITGPDNSCVNVADIIELTRSKL